MSIDIRYARHDELSAIVDLDGASFGFQYTPDEINDVVLDIDVDGMLAAYDSERLVGVSCEVPFTMTLPGGSTSAMGLSWVSVETTHRRRGILRQLVEHQLHAAADRAVPVVVLTASESSIYGRFGFGTATRTRQTVIDRTAARLARPVTDHGVTRLRTEQARDLLPDIYARWQQMTPGALDRNANRWQLQLTERAWSQQGRSALFHLVHRDGYVSYRIGRESGPIGHRNTCAIVDYAWCTPEAHAGLWQVLLGLDLCATIETARIPLDDPLPHLLTDARQVRTAALTDGLWVRPLDVAALLSARHYSVEVDVVLGVRDPLLGDAHYRLKGGPDGAECVRTDGAADVELDVATLGAVVLGGERLVSFARAGLANGDGVALARLDRALLGDVVPQLGTYF